MSDNNGAAIKVPGSTLAFWIGVGVALGFAAFFGSVAFLGGKNPDPSDAVKALPAVAAFLALIKSADVIFRLVGAKATKDAEKWQAQSYDDVRELYKHCWNGALFSYALGVTAWFASGRWWGVPIVILCIFGLATSTAWMIVKGQEKRDAEARAARSNSTGQPISRSSADREA